MASNFAHISLYLWPLVVFLLFRKRPIDEAMAWSIICGYLLLPQFTAFDLPMLPPWDKLLVPSLSAAIVCFFAVKSSSSSSRVLARSAGDYTRGSVTASYPEFKVRRGQVLFWSLTILLFATPIITTLTNSKPIVEELRFVQGLELYDGLSMNLALLVQVAPFLLARRYLSTAESHSVLLKVFVLAILGYSILALWEVRMSPRLHANIYGFFPHRWAQHARYGGFRPVIFLNHGLWVAILFAMGTVGAMAMWRERLKIPEKKSSIWFFGALYLFVVVVLCKSAGAIIIAVLLMPIVLLFGLRLQMLIATVIICIILTYPALRGADLVPTNSIYSAVAKIDSERAKSLQIRFDAEDKLLARANQKPWAGWGSYGRNRVTQEKGEAFTATDGYWVIVAGAFGWLGYIAQFGLLGISTILLTFNRRRLNLEPATAGLALMLVAALIDLIPNATISPIVWLLAGSLMGRYQTAQAVTGQQVRVQDQEHSTDQNNAPVPENVVTRSVLPKSESPPIHRRQPRKG